MNIFKYFNFFNKYVGNLFLISLIFGIISVLFDSVGIVLFFPLITSEVPESSIFKYITIYFQDFHKLYFKSISFDIFLAIIIVLIFVIKFIFNFSSLLIVAFLKSRMQSKIREDFINYYSNIKYLKSKDLTFGDLLNLNVEQTTKSLAAFNNYHYTIIFFLNSLIYITLAFFSNSKLAIVVISLCFIISFFFRYINKYVKDYSLKNTYILSKYSGSLSVFIANIFYLRVTNKISFYNNILKKQIKDIKDVLFKAGVFNALTKSLQEPISIILLGFLILFNTLFLEIPLTSLIITLVLFYRAFVNLLKIQGHWQGTLDLIGSVIFIEDKIKYIKRNISSIHNNNHLRKFEKINFNNINITYGSKQISSGIDISLISGNIYSIIGDSGVGKTSLLNVISGVQSFKNTVIEVDGCNVSSLEDYNYFSNISYIKQGLSLFNLPIMSNILLDKKFDQNKYNEVIKYLDIDHIIRDVPHDNYNPNEILSGGQIQKILIARELYADKKVFILDEATSALDSKSEIKVFEYLSKIKNKIIIFVSHNIHLCRYSHYVLELKKTEPNIYGRYLELINNKNSKLYNIK